MARIKHTGPKKPVDPHPAPRKAAPSIKMTKNRVSKPAKMSRSAKSTFSKDTIILYESILYGIGNKIDHKAVAKALSIKVPAARMRHGRLLAKIAATRPRRGEPAEQIIESSSGSDLGDSDKTMGGDTLSSAINGAGNAGKDSQEDTPEQA